MQTKCFELLQKQRARSGTSKTSLSFLGGTSVVVPQYPCVYGLEQYDHMNDNCPLCFLFCFLLIYKMEMGKNRCCCCSNEDG